MGAPPAAGFAPAPHRVPMLSLDNAMNADEMRAFGERIAIKSRREIEQMREIGRFTAEILLELRSRAEPGMTTGELDQIADHRLAIPADISDLGKFARLHLEERSAG